MVNESSFCVRNLWKTLIGLSSVAPAALPPALHFSIFSQ
jgi:hypothetical protein